MDFYTYCVVSVNPIYPIFIFEPHIYVPFKVGDLIQSRVCSLYDMFLLRFHDFFFFFGKKFFF